MNLPRPDRPTGPAAATESAATQPATSDGDTARLPRRITRRKLLTWGSVGLATAVGGYYATRQRIKVGLIGTGERGAYHSNLLKRMSYALTPYASVVAICDAQLDKAHAARNQDWPAAKVYQDYRQLLANDDIEAVYVVTPDHWHAGMGIDVMRAGKALYLEKPISLTIDECFRLRDVAAQTGAVVQVGTQQRSQTMFQTAREIVRNGRLGQLQKIIVSLQTSCSHVTLSAGASSPPKSLDWDLWLGPTAEVPYCELRHLGWQCMADYSGGMLTNWGSHHLDCALWASGDQNSYPLRVDGSGTLADLPDGTGVPASFDVTLTYPSGLLVEIKTTPKDHGIRFEGDQGHIFVNRARLSGKPVDDLSTHPLPADGHRVNSRRMPQPRQKLAEIQHYRDFFDCIRTGEVPIADLPSSVCVHTALHLAGLSIALGRPLEFDAKALTITGDPEAAALMSRPRRAPFRLG